MSALEIVLTALSGALVCAVVMAFVIIGIVTKALTKKVVDYEVLNEYAPENPIVFLGDSLTDLYPLHEFIHDDRILNRGISNETTFDIKRRLKDVTGLNPSRVIMLCGINDFLRLKGKQKPRVVAERIISIAEQLKETCHDVRVVSLYPVYKKKTKLTPFYLRKVTNELILTTNIILKKLCDEKGFEYLDVHSLLVDTTGNLKPEYTVEGLHLNLNGYKAVTPFYKLQVEEK